MGERESWRDLFPRTISAWQDGRLDEGRLACDRALAHPDLPPEVATNIRRNSVHYAPSLAELAPSHGERTLQPGGVIPEGWFATNPSLVHDADGFVVSLRVLNYAMPGYVRAEGDQAYRSRTALMRLDPEGNPWGAAVMLAENLVSPREEDDYYQGAEDLRLLRAGGRLMASGCAARRIGPNRDRTISYGLFDVDPDAGLLQNPRWLSDMPGSVEKNWMPAVSGDDLWFVYSCGPTVVLRCDPETGRLEQAAHHAASPLAMGLRGGTQLLPDGDGWIAIVHESAQWESSHRTYLHRVIRFGSDWRITHLSHPFRFKKADIEFAGGLARRGDRLLIGYGTDDQAAWLVDLEESELVSLLRPIDELSRPGAEVSRSSGSSALRLARSHALPAEWKEFLGLPTLVLNLDQRPDQLLVAHRRAIAAGFSDIRRVQALDGGYAAKMRIGWRRIGKPRHHPGEPEFSAETAWQGRLLTHLLTWQWIIENEIPAAVVLEDDARFHERWADLATGIYGETPKDIDLLHLGGTIQSFVPGEFSSETPTETTLPAASPAADLAGSLAALRLPTHGVTAYAVTLDGARRLLHWVTAMPGGVYSVESMVNHVERRALTVGPLAMINWRSWNRPVAADHDSNGRFGGHGLVASSGAADDRGAEVSTLPAEPGVAGDVPELPVIHLVPDLFAGVEMPSGPTTSNLTLVSMLIHLSTSSLDPAGRLAMLVPLFASGIPLVLYADSYYLPHLEKMAIPHWVTVRRLELAELSTMSRLSELTEPPRLPSVRHKGKDNPEFLALINGKTEVVERAIAEGLVRTPYTGFIDSGIAKVLEHPQESLERLASADLTGLDRVLIPGFEEIRRCSVEELSRGPSWMFCGGLFLLPTALARDFNRRCLGTFDEFIYQGLLVWEVNVWARLAGQHPELFEWYQADHNDGMLMIPHRPCQPDGEVSNSADRETLEEVATSAPRRVSDLNCSSSSTHPGPSRLNDPWPRAWEDAVFAPAFILNLDRRPDRLGWAASRVRDAGFRLVRRVRAVDGQDAEFLARAWERAGNPPFDPDDPLFAAQPGRQGCYLSMTLLLRWIVDRELPLATIFHDDALFHSRWHEFAPVFYAETPRDIDLLVIGGCIDRQNGDGLVDLQWSTRIQRRPLSDANAIMVTRRGAQRLLEALSGADGGVRSFDEMVNRAQRTWLDENPATPSWWAAWNAAAIPDPRLEWLPEQREHHHGLVYQQLELGSDVDAEREASLQAAVAHARERGSAAVPPVAGAPGVSPRLPGFDLLDCPAGRDVLPSSAPSRGHLTLVSTLMLIPNSRMDPRHRAALLGPLMESGIPLVLYLDRHYQALMSDVVWPEWVQVHPLEFDELETVKAVKARSSIDVPLFGTGPASFESLCLMNAKPELVARAVHHGLVSTPVTGFIDAGIAKFLSDWQAALARLRTADLLDLGRILIPGPWAPSPVAPAGVLDFVNWTFAGSLFLTPTDHASRFSELAAAALEEFLDLGNLPWEVNAWAVLRQRHPDLISWYFGDHDDSIAELPVASDGWASPRAGLHMRYPIVHYFVERSSAAYFEGKQDEGRLASELGLNHPEATDAGREVLRRNAVHYSSLLAGLSQRLREWRIPFADVGERWPVVRLAWHDGAAVMCGLRDNSGDAVEAQRPGSDGLRLVFASLGADGNIRTGEEAGLDSDASASACENDGWSLVDVHLLTLRGRLTCVQVHAGPGFAGGGPVSLRLASVRAEGDAPFRPNSDQHRVMSTGSRPVAAFAEGAEPRLVTGIHPFTVSVFDRETGEVRHVAMPDAPAQWRHASGLTTLVPCENGWLSLMHDMAEWEPGAPAALHRVVRFDNALRLTHMSFPFRLHGAPRETATGLAILPADGSEDGPACATALIAFIVDGHEPWLASLPLADLANMLEPVERFGWMPPELPDALDTPKDAPRIEPSAAVPPLPPPHAEWPATWQEVLAAPAFVINLDRSPERLGPVLERIREAGFLDVRRVRAVDGIDDVELRRRWAEVGNPALRDEAGIGMREWPGYQGNFLSHVLLWRRIVEENIPYAMILEDDVLFHERWHDLAPAMFAETPPGTAVTWIGGTADVYRRAERVIQVPVTGLHAMLVTRRGAEQLLDITLNDPDGVVILDRMIEAAQRDVLAGTARVPFDWAVWHAVGAPDRRHQPEDSELTGWGTGLAFQDINEGSMSNPKWTDSFYWRHTMEAHAAGDFALGRLACDRFRSLHHAEESWLTDTRRNQLFYVQRLSEAASDARLSLIERRTGGERQLPPGLAASGAGLIAALVGQPGREGSAAVRLVALTADGAAPGEIAGPVAWPEGGGGRLADVRLVGGAAGARAIAVRARDTGGFGVDVYPLDGASPELTAPGRMIATGGDGWRPTWSVGAEDDGVLFVARYGPTVALRFPWQGTAPAVAANQPAPRFAENFVGGCPLVAYGDGYLTVVREHANWPGRGPLTDPDAPLPEVYPPGLHTLHRLVTLDREFRITRLTHPFVFGSVGDEACGGLAVLGERAYLAYDAAHSETWVASLPLDEVERLLQPVTNLMLDGMYEWPDVADRLPVAGLRDAGLAIAGPAPAQALRERAPWPLSWEELLSAPAFVINLDRSPERLEPVMQRIRDAGFSDVRRESAVDGMLEDALQKGWKTLGTPVFPNGLFSLVGQPGYQGSLISHALVWKKIVDQNLPFATIFEDDVVFHEQWQEMGPDWLAMTPPGTNVIWMGAATEMPTLPEEPVSSVPVLLIHALFVTREGARQLLDIALRRKDGAIVLDQALRLAQEAIIAGDEGLPLDWVVWHSIDRPDSRFQTGTLYDQTKHLGLVFQDAGWGSLNSPESTVYEHLKLTLDAYATGDFALGRLACDRFRSLHKLEESSLTDTRRNQLFYLQRLSEAASDVRFASIERRDGGGQVLPPSLATDGHRLVAAMIEHKRDPHGAACRLVALTPDAGNVASVADTTVWPEERGGPLADVRVMTGEQGIRAVAVTGLDGEEFSVGVFDVEPASLDIRESWRSVNPMPGGWRPNWSIAAAGSEVIYVPRFGPTIAARWTREGQGPALVACQPAPRFAENFVGGCPLVAYESGYLTVVREHAAWPGGAPLTGPDTPLPDLYPPGLHTLHRLLALDGEFRITRLSHPFVFGSPGEEACGGLALLGDRAYLAYDAAHGETWVASLPLDEVERLLRPVTNLMLDGMYRWPERDWLRERLEPLGRVGR